MRNILFATTALVALVAVTPAKADVVLDTKLSGTGTNVVFNSVDIGGHTALGSLNDPNSQQNVVRFGALDFLPTFNAAQNGNDIKIVGTNDLDQGVRQNRYFLGWHHEQVFSLSGDGTVKLFVTAVDANGNAEALKTFTLDPLKSGQNGFTLTAINGEVMTGLVIIDTNGTITDFEHYRIDVAAIPLAPAVPEASTWAMMIAGFFGIGGVAMWRRRRDEGHAFRLA
jgi:hypothetical protein